MFHTAFLESLKMLLPESKIDLWLKSRLADIVENDPRFNDILFFDDIRTANYNDRSNLNLRGKISFLKKLKKNKYDVVFDLTGKYSTAIFTLLSAPRYSVGINYNFFGFCYDRFVNLDTSTEKGHLIKKYISIVPYGLKLSDEEWEKIKEKIEIRPYIYVDDDTKIFINKKLDKIKRNNGNPLIILHATSGWRAKELDTEIFAELIKYFNLKKYNFAFVGKEEDRKKLEEIKSFLKERDFEIERIFLPLKFLQTAELIKRSDLFIGSDSAPLHIAGAVGTPSIGIFGPTNPEFSKPFGNDHQVIYHRLFCSAAEDRQYCTKNGGFTCPTVDCIKMIKSKEIIDMIENVFAKQKLSSK